QSTDSTVPPAPNPSAAEVRGHRLRNVATSSMVSSRRKCQGPASANPCVGGIKESSASVPDQGYPLSARSRRSLAHSLLYGRPPSCSRLSCQSSAAVVG